MLYRKEEKRSLFRALLVEVYTICSFLLHFYESYVAFCDSLADTLSINSTWSSQIYFSKDNFRMRLIPRLK